MDEDSIPAHTDTSILPTTITEAAPGQDGCSTPALDNSPAFIHLRLHSEYSISDSIVRIKQAIQAARACDMPALALTDFNNCFGLLKFYSAARNNGIKPICGIDCLVSNAENSPYPYRLLLLIKNLHGYQQISELISHAYQSSRHGQPVIEHQWLCEADNSGLIALSGAEHSDVGEALLAGHEEAAERRALVWSKLFPHSYYIELQRYGQPHSEELVSGSVQLAERLGLPIVATHPVQFMLATDFQAHEVRVCIADGQRLGDQNRQSRFTTDQYFKTPQQMQQIFADLPEALTNSVEIARRCNLEMQLDEVHLPAFPTPQGMSLADYLAEQAHSGLHHRLETCFPDSERRQQILPDYEVRLENELQIIVEMDFPGYFLIVSDFINWAKNIAEPPIPVGPGRGSGAGSLVAFALGITDLDPLAYGLLFERFLNPDRVSLPDFDIDFCQEERWRVIEYVRKRYGEKSVSQIVTFGTLASKAVIRDIGRVLDLPIPFCDRLAKMVPVIQNKPVSLAEAKKETSIQEMLVSDQDGAATAELFSLGQMLEGLVRNVGTHAGGVLITPGTLTDYCPLYTSADSDAATISQFDKDDVEKAGLVKFDFLGLRNLTVIQRTLQSITDSEGTYPQLAHSGFEDPLVYENLKKANTTAVFQLESTGMKKLLRKLRPDNFEDIIAVVALYRPGPLGSGMVDDFIRRKNGNQPINYFHPDLKQCLEPTYGVIVYQEQVMQISQIIGGYSLGAADLLRRAMGKKKADEMAKHRESFCDGAVERSYSRSLAEQLFELMVKFAEYGFNKSHTAAYAVITYHTAWLKTHYPTAFMAATLSSDMDNTDSIKLYYDDTRDNNLRILPPDINSSDYIFLPTDKQNISYGLGAIKGVGQQAAELIVSERETNGKFADLFDFCRRVDKKQVNRRAIEALIRAGAFDNLAEAGLGNRAKMLATVEFALGAAEQAERDAMQVSLFASNEVKLEQLTPRVEVRPWSELERLREEKTALGIYFSGHPYGTWREELSHIIKHNLHELETWDAGKANILVAGIVVSERAFISRRGKVRILKLDDGSAEVEVTVFDELYRSAADKIRADHILLVDGQVNFDQFTQSNRIAAKELLTLTEARNRYARLLKLQLNGNMRATFLQDLLAPYFSDSGCQVRIDYQNKQAGCKVELGAQYKVRLDDELLSQLSQQLGKECFSLEYSLDAHANSDAATIMPPREALLY